MQSTHATGAENSTSALTLSVKSWFAIAAVGQLAFIYFILRYYGSRTAAGDYAAWDEKPLIEGYVAGDTIGNLMFHYTCAARGGNHFRRPAPANSLLPKTMAH